MNTSIIKGIVSVQVTGSEALKTFNASAFFLNLYRYVKHTRKLIIIWIRDRISFIHRGVWGSVLRPPFLVAKIVPLGCFTILSLSTANSLTSRRNDVIGKFACIITCINDQYTVQFTINICKRGVTYQAANNCKQYNHDSYTATHQQ